MTAGLLTAAALGGCGGTPAGAPPLAFDHIKVEVGEILQQEVVPVAWPFRVSAPAGCAVTKLTSSCGCTRPRLLVAGEVWPLGAVMPAGTRGSIAAEFKSGHHSGPKETTLTLQTTAAAEPLRLHLSAFVKTVFRTEPVLARFGRVPRGRGAAAEVRVWGYRPWTVEEWKGLPPGVAAEDLGPEADGDGEGGSWHRIRIRIAPGASLGGLYGAATAETSLGKPFAIPLAGQIVAAAAYLPESLDFGDVPAGTAARRTLVVQLAGAPPDLPAPEVAWADRGPFRTEGVEKAGEGRWLVRVLLPAGAPAGPCTGTLRVLLSGDWAPESRALPVRGRVLEARERGPDQP